MNNGFANLSQEENIIQNCVNNSLSFTSKYKCKSYLINGNLKNELNKLNSSVNTTNTTMNNTNTKKEIGNKCLSYSIDLYKGYLNLYETILKSNYYSPNIINKDNEYYLINKDYVNELESIIQFKEISNIIESNQEIKT